MEIIIHRSSIVIVRKVENTQRVTTSIGGSTMATSKVQEDSVGVIFTSTIKDQDGTIVDLSGASVIQFIFENPLGELLVVDGETVNGGTDGQIQYVVESGDLGVPGSWKYQTRVAWTGVIYYSSITKFKVVANLS